MLGEPENQFSLTCEALGTPGAEKANSYQLIRMFLSVRQAALGFLCCNLLSTTLAASTSLVAWGGGRAPSSGLTNIVAIASGYWHSLGLRDDGTMVVWGDNYFGQLGMPGGLSNVVAIACGYAHSLALQNDGKIVSWGGGGPFDPAIISVPAGISNVAAIAGGRLHSLALRRDGTVTNWGDYWPSERPMPIPASVTNIVAISAGLDHDLLLRGDGSVCVWGWNGLGQTNIPPNLTNVLAVSAGGDHNLALTADGAVVAWGNGDSGLSNVPPNLTNVAAVVAGPCHNLALLASGQVVGWGYNGDGQTNVPAGTSAVEALAAGVAMSLALVGRGPPPAFVSANQPSLEHGGFSVTALSTRGRRYRLELKNSLSDVSWGATAPAAGDDTAIPLTDSSAELPMRFYRVRQW